MSLPPATQSRRSGLPRLCLGRPLPLVHLLHVSVPDLEPPATKSLGCQVLLGRLREDLHHVLSEIPAVKFKVKRGMSESVTTAIPEVRPEV